MSDVEKYGLFALAFVVLVLGIAWILDPADEPALAGGQGVLQRTVAMSRPDGSPEDLAARRLAVLNRPDASTSKGATASAPANGYRVPGLLEGLGPFDPAEPPVSYPGERSAAPVLDGGGRIEHVVKEGDTLSSISQRYFRTAGRHAEILKLNPGLDAKRLQPGTRLVVQAGIAASPAAPVAGASAASPAKPVLYTVLDGETLGHIAQKTKGSVAFTDAIFAANRDVLKTADAIQPGMTLRIP